MKRYRGIPTGASISTKKNQMILSVLFLNSLLTISMIVTSQKRKKAMAKMMIAALWREQDSTS